MVVPNYVSAEEYLSIERQSMIRHEYRRGLMYAMGSERDSHNTITMNLLTLVGLHLRDSSACHVHSGSVKVNYKDELYYCPDAFVTCDARDYNSRYTKQYPKLVVEVLASSTQAFDRGEKLNDYQRIESLEEYVLISQQNQRVECYRRTASNMWDKTIYETGDLIMLKSIDLEFEISELYRNVNS